MRPQTAKLQKMMKAYAQRQAVDITAYQFLFDGKRIKESDTIEGLELEVRCEHGYAWSCVQVGCVPCLQKP